jgi:hypothetical protein
LRESIRRPGVTATKRQVISIFQWLDRFGPLLTRLRASDFNFVKNGDPEKVVLGQWFLYIGEDNREPGCTCSSEQS